MLGKIKGEVTLSGTTWVTAETLAGYAKIKEIWLKVPNDAGAGTGIYVGLFDPEYTTDGEERYNSGLLLKDAVYPIRYETQSGTDLPLSVCTFSGDLLKMKSDGAFTSAVSYIVLVEEDAG